MPPLILEGENLPRKCKCYLCKKEITVDEAILYDDMTLKTPKTFKFCSQECINKYIEESKLKIQEKQDFAELCDYIMQTFNQKFISNGFFVMLNDLRNGTIRKNGIVIKGNKQGVKWAEILITYIYCKDKIEWALANKEFKSDMAKLNYCLAIVKNNISKAVFNYKKKNNDKNINIDNVIENERTNYDYKAKTFKNDISDIL